MAFLSAIICSNAATLAKFNRMGFLAGWRPPDLTMRREGILLDRTPGALAGVPFDLDILSDDYTALWQPYGEQWCVELEGVSQPAGGSSLSLRSVAWRHALVRGRRRNRLQHNLEATGAVIDNTAHAFVSKRLTHATEIRLNYKVESPDRLSAQRGHSFSRSCTSATNGEGLPPEYIMCSSCFARVKPT